jgi:hypothetical protein
MVSTEVGAAQTFRRAKHDVVVREPRNLPERVVSLSLNLRDCRSVLQFLVRLDLKADDRMGTVEGGVELAIPNGHI